MQAETPKPSFFKELAKSLGVSERTPYNWFSQAGALAWRDLHGDRLWFGHEDWLWAQDWNRFRLEVSPRVQIYLSALKKNNYQRYFG